ncbi:MAG: DUF819 domain-containing protein, partial [Salibacteraceae bacterium]
MEEAEQVAAPLLTNDASVLGVLILVLALVFATSSSKAPFFQKFYKFVPSLLLCYFLPALLSSLGIIPSEGSKLYFVASRYLLPASLVLLCVSIDLKGVINLGPRALVMFLTATIGIVVGGPAAIWIVSGIAPEVFQASGEGMELWRGLATVAGSWIGGGANQAAMKEVYSVDDDLFSAMLLVDIFVANFWMMFLLIGAGATGKLDKLLKSNTSAIDSLRTKMENFSLSSARIPTTTSLFLILAVGFGATGLAHFGSDLITPIMESNIDPNGNFASLQSGFFWLIVIATTVGVLLSFTSARNLEGSGASKIGSVFIYILVATIGMKMDLAALIENWETIKWLLLIGLIWMAV